MWVSIRNTQFKSLLCFTQPRSGRAPALNSLGLCKELPGPGCADGTLGVGWGMHRPWRRVVMETRFLIAWGMGLYRNCSITAWYPAVLQGVEKCWASMALGIVLPRNQSRGTHGVRQHSPVQFRGQQGVHKTATKLHFILAFPPPTCGPKATDHSWHLISPLKAEQRKDCDPAGRFLLVFSPIEAAAAEPGVVCLGEKYMCF